ncbi:MAG: patatin-like phospholipase family protein [Gammaproteobacteria bacterium]|nr:patatin-like phospholipase family protein [Gammaproteobacteria bacterium]
MIKTLRALWAAGLIMAASAVTAADCTRPSIGLALGSGGAGGLAHIAMLKVFEDLELRPDGIAGTSIGAIIGTLHAAGLKAEEIQTLFREFGGSALDPLSGLAGDDAPPGWSDLLMFDLENGGFVDAGRFLDFIAESFDARDFGELEIPLQIVATDYWSGESHVFREGDLLTAVKASMAVPGLFAPVRLDDKLLIDGGTSNPLPVDLLGDFDVVVAIDVTGVRKQSGDDAPAITELLFKTFDIMQQSIIRSKTNANAPDIYIKPELAGVRLLHFDRVDEIVRGVEDDAATLRDRLEALTACR